MLKSPQIFQSPQNVPTKKGALPAQTSFKGCSGIFDKMIYLFQKDESLQSTAASMQPSYAWGKDIGAPNSKKGMNYYELMYDKDCHSEEQRNKFIAKEIESKAVKEYLKRAFELADREGIVYERSISCHAGSVQSLGRCDNDSDDVSTSDDGSNYEIDDSAVVKGDMFDRVDEESDCEDEINVIGPGWKLDS
eukprot:12561993-Ditylum_brightwellii.AAC.1